MNRSKLVACIATIAVLTLFTTTYAKVDTEKGPTLQTKSAPLDVATSADGKWTYVLAAGGKVYIFAQDGQLSDTIDVDPSATQISVSPQGETLYAVNPKSNGVQQIKINYIAEINIAGSPFRGKKDAPVTLVEFSDFECPYCGSVSPIIDELLKKNPNTLKVVFMHFPLSFHKSAVPAALSAIAAQNQGKFWEYHDKLFANQKNLNQAKTNEIATEVGLDLQKFQRDFMSPESRKKLSDDMQQARDAGVRGTPTLFINGRRVNERSVESIQKMIDEELAHLKKNGKK